MQISDMSAYSIRTRVVGLAGPARQRKVRELAEVYRTTSAVINEILEGERFADVPMPRAPGHLATT